MSKLAMLVEPLTLRVTRLKGSIQQPVELPSKDGTPSNTTIGGLSREDVLQTEKLVLQIAGGGIYRADVTDANNESFTWTWGYQAPERPAMSMDPFGTQVAPVQAPMGQQAASWPPMGYGMGASTTPVQPQATPWGPPQVGPWGFSPQWGGGGENERMRRLEEQLQAERLARQEERHRAEMDRLRQEMNATRQSPAQDAAVKQLQEELAREREERRRMEAENRHREEMRALSAKIDALAAAPRGPDPMIEFMRENTRMQAEIAKEIARSTQAQFERMTALTMNPSQLVDMIEKKGNSVDTTVKGMVDSFSGIMDLQQRVVENMMQLNGPESPAIGIVKDGISTAKDIANRYLRSREAEKNAAANVEITRHQAAVAQAQIQAHTRAMNGAAEAPPPAAQTPAAPPSPKAAETARDDTAAQPVGPAAGAPQAIPPTPTEIEMFGPAMEHVLRLRLGVRQGLPPDEVVKAIIRGLDFVAMNKIPVPAFELAEQGAFLEMVELLIPDAPTAMKEAVIATLVETYGDPEEGEVEEGEEEGEEEETDEPPQAASAR